MNWKSFRFIILLLCFMAFTAQTYAQNDPEETTLDEMLEAAETFPNDPTIAYALGLHYGRENRLGLAILYLERAHLLSPLRKNIRDALHTVRIEARRRRADDMPAQTITEGEPAGIFWWRFFHVFSTRTYAFAFSAAIWIFFGLLAASRKMKAGARRDIIFTFSFLSLFVSLVAAAFWIGSFWTTEHHEPAVIVASSPNFVDAPDESARAHRQKNLYEGAVVVILEDRGEWRLLRLVDDEEVWVRAEIARSVLLRF